MTTTEDRPDSTCKLPDTPLGWRLRSRDDSNRSEPAANEDRPDSTGKLPDTPLGWRLRSRDDSNRSESAATTAFVLALVSLAIAPLAVPALILTHWAARGSQRTVALVVGWLVSVGMVAAIIAVVALGAAASNAANNSVSDYENSPYYLCMSNPNTSVSDCTGLSTNG